MVALHRLSPLLLALALCACGDPKGPAAAGAGTPPPPAVGVLTVQPQTVSLMTELPGRVEALRTAQVRARVSGVVQERLFQEGSEVKAGQSLMRIDPAPYQAALEAAQAQLLRAEATLAQANQTAQRLKPLGEVNAVSQQDVSVAEAARQVAEADAAAARANLSTARLNLGHASVPAPISGRIGRALVTEGALVSATEATPLALIQQVDRVYVNLTQSSSDVLRLKRALANGQAKRSEDTLGVHVLLEDGSELPQTGKLLFADLSVDASSGQVSLRAEVPNAQGLLMPGQFVRVRLATVSLPQAVLVPQQAVTRSAQGDSVLLVGEDNKPQPRKVSVSHAQAGQWVVTDGLKAGERVIVDGFQKMMVPGAPVKPVPWTPGAAPGPASAAAAAAASAASR